MPAHTHHVLGRAGRDVAGQTLGRQPARAALRARTSRADIGGAQDRQGVTEVNTKPASSAAVVGLYHSDATGPDEIEAGALQ